MTRKLDSLDKLQIPAPCPADWDRMSGSDQVRYCGECQRHVYNLSAMSRSRAQAIVSAARGRLCARIIRLSNAPAMTLHPESLDPRPHFLVRRASPLASALVTALLGLSQSVSPQVTARLDPTAPAATRAAATSDNLDHQASGATAALAGMVIDPQGAVIPGVTVTLINERTHLTQFRVTNFEGEFEFPQLEAGSYTIKASANGFKRYELNQIPLTIGPSKQLAVTLEVDPTLLTEAGVVVSSSQPLRVLYEDSDLIAIVEVGSSEVVEPSEYGQLMKTTLHLSSTLKGYSPEQSVPVYHWTFKDERPAFVLGDTLLVFLERDEDREDEVARAGYKVDQEYYGVKKLLPSDLALYRERIEELAAILRAEDPDPLALVEWLVRCAEEPATRWEGAYELLQSAREMASRSDQDNVEEEESGDQASELELDPADLFASLLSDTQKDRLTTALLNTEKLTHRDYDLVQLVSAWAPQRLMPFLLVQLQMMKEAPPREAEILINTLAEIMRDPMVQQAAEDYSENASYDDQAEEAVTEETTTGNQAELGEAALQAVKERRRMLSEFLNLMAQRQSLGGSRL